jgi:hypothetical protein
MKRWSSCAYVLWHADVWGVLNTNRLLTPAPVWDECSTPRSSQFTVGINWTGGWMDPSAGLDAVEKRGENLHSLPGNESRSAARRQSPNGFMCSIRSNYRTKEAANNPTKQRTSHLSKYQVYVNKWMYCQKLFTPSENTPCRLIRSPWILCQRMQAQHLPKFIIKIKFSQI